jgi:hypothetical protein
MSKLETLGQMKGFLLALLGIALGGVVIVSLTSATSNGESSLSHNMSIFVVLLLLWLFVTAALGILFLASHGSSVIKPITLPVNREEE